MVNGTLGMGERELILGYAPADARVALAALLDLDRVLGKVVRTTSQPMVGRIRLAWWREALETLDRVAPPAEPTLRAIAAAVLPAVPVVALAAMVEGWEALLEEPLESSALRDHAAARGAGLFRAAGQLLGSTNERLAAAGEGWAFADLSRGLSDPALAADAREMARTRLSAGLTGRWPTRDRFLGALAHAAALDLAGARPQGHPARAARLAWHWLTGG